MNRKTFLILLGVVGVLGIAGLVLFWQDLGAWRGGDAKVGTRIFEKLQVSSIAQVHLKDAKGEATLSLKDGRWVVRERNDYSASTQGIGDLLLKLPDLKVVQTQSVGASLLPRLELAEPGKDGKAENTGTRLELSDTSGKVIGSLLLGKKVIKIEDSPLPVKQETPVGRYILTPGNPAVLVVSDALKNADAKPERWLARDFFKIERIKTLAMSGDGAPWKITRSEEYGQWKFADGAGQLDPSSAVATVNALASVAFADVALDVKSGEFDKPRTLSAETFDGLVYTIRIARKPGGDDYYLSLALAGEPPRERKPEKGEKAEDKEKRDKQFADELKKFDERVKFEKSLSAWTYVMSAKAVEPLLKERAQLVAPARKP